MSGTAQETITNPDNSILASPASAWEISTKVRLGKLPDGADLVQNFGHFLHQFSFEPISISMHDAVRAGLLPLHHKDPFDRMLAAQCQAESIPIISNDRIFELYGVNRIW